MINGKQIAVIGLVVVLMGLLFSLDIKGLVKEEGQASGETAQAAAPQTATVSLETVSASAKQMLNANLSSQIEELENKLKTAEGAERVSLQKELGQKWDDVNQPAPSALYYELVAESDNNYTSWIKAGDLFTSAYQITTDTLVQPAYVNKAINAYQKAAALQPESLEAKTGLGVAYVSGTPNPMEGIQLLLEVVKEDPSNVKANMNLGLFSIKSGQFDKAIDRFKAVLDKQETPEAWFYLATCYENTGRKEDAIVAYEKSKELAADQGFSTYIDQRVKELKGN